ncbi:MAG: glyceraldehyde 3-phosphate dehydrogenase, partial [Oceanospirillaceae bacterium]
MTIRIAINGFGRIGRNIVRAIYEHGPIDYHKHFEIVAINDLGCPQTNAHLLRFDSVHGRFNGQVEYDDQHLYVNQDKI